MAGRAGKQPLSEFLKDGVTVIERQPASYVPPVYRNRPPDQQVSTGAKGVDEVLLSDGKTVYVCTDGDDYASPNSVTSVIIHRNGVHFKKKDASGAETEEPSEVQSAVMGTVSERAEVLNNTRTMARRASAELLAALAVGTPESRLAEEVAADKTATAPVVDKMDAVRVLSEKEQALRRTQSVGDEPTYGELKRRLGFLEQFLAELSRDLDGIAVSIHEDRDIIMAFEGSPLLYPQQRLKLVELMQEKRNVRILRIVGDVREARKH